MLMKKYNVQWTPGITETQSLYVKIDDAGFALVASELVPTVTDYIVSIPATAKIAKVVVSSDVTGQVSVNSDSFDIT